MTTILTGQEVLDLLVKHNVSVPVGFLLDAGIVKPQSAPKWGMTYLELWQQASLEECIRWTASGVCERLLIKDGKVMGWGRYTRLHVLMERKGSQANRPYACEPVSLTKEQLWAAGGQVSFIPAYVLRVPRTHQALCKIQKTTRNILTEPA